MSNKDIRDRLKGLFSNVVSDPRVENESSPEEATADPIEPGATEVEVHAGESEAEAHLPTLAEPKRADSLEITHAQPPPEATVSFLASIRSRLMITLLLATAVPLLVTGIWSLYTLQRASTLATEQSEAAVAEMGEAVIHQTAEATARQIELYLRTHPGVDLADIAQLEGNTELAQIAVQPVGQTGYTAVFDANGITHFHANPATVGMDMSTLADTLPEFWAIFAASLDGSPSDGYYDWQEADGQIRAKYMSIAPVGDTPLRVAATTYIDEFSQPTVEIRSQLAGIRRTASVQLLVVLGVATLAAFGGAYVLGQQLSKPIRQIASAAARVVVGDLRPLGWQERHDEIGLLARAFNSMVVQVRQTLGGLEERVTERTRALELAADVGRRLSTVRDLDALLGEAVELIRSSFDLYYAQVYLTDPAGRDLILRAGTGEAGAALVRRGHMLPVGPGSINGTAAAEKRAVIVSDTAQSAVFKPNPLLPDTRSEMAVPLMVGGQVVGVLNLQHNQPGSLTDATLPVFETLAGQFAIAVDNANLFAETAQARAEVEAQLKRMARTGWQDFMDGIQRSERIGYAYTRDTLEPIAEPLAAMAEAHVLATPIQVQEAPVGVIQVEGKAGRAWTEAEAELVESVARQVAQQVENLRILAQADRYRAEAEQATRRLTREGWQAYLAAKAESSASFVYDRYEVKPLTGEASATAEAGEPTLTRPLQVHGETIGRLSLGEVAVLGDEATGLMDTVTERLSAHIENLRLFEETRTREHELEERSRELAASQRVTFAATETTDPDELLDLVVNLIRDQFGLYHAQVYLVDEKKRAAVLRKSTGYAGRQLLEQGHQIPLKQASLVTKAIREGEPVVVDDVSEDESWTSNPLLPDTQSELVLPLKTSEGVIGALDVLSRTPGTFTPHTVALFQTMAEQVAMNFQTTDLLTRTTEQAETLTRYARQLHTAAEVTERVSAILDPDQLLNEVVELLQSRFGLYHAHIYLLDEPPQELLDRADPTEVARITREHRLFMCAGSGEVGKVLRERGHSIPLDAEHSLVASAARSRETRVVNDTSREPDFMPNPLLPQTRSELSIPLITGNKVLGVLDVQDDRPGRFGQSDVATFSTLAGQVATALQNAAFFEELQQAAERLRELDRLKSEFLANMSHELRTPLNSIIGYAELILLDMEDTMDPDTLEDVQAIHDNGKHLLQLINDVLDLAKIEAGQLELSFEQVQIEPLLDAARASAIGLLVDKPIEMRVEVEENLPSIVADTLRLNQILNNLVANAVKFTEKGYIALRAFADGDEQGEAGWIHIQVEDTGIGISEEDQALIFERFRQSDNSFERRAEGTGLGLAITRHLAHLHGGEIEVRSQLGKGSTFTVHLPIQGPGAKAAARLENS